MSTQLVTMWVCDICALVVPACTDGWANAVWSHGCPEHAEHVGEHRASVREETRGRGRSEKTTWFLTCACGWVPPRRWSSWNYGPLVEQHHEHLRASRPGATTSPDPERSER